MSDFGIICEFNPFHNGHARLFKEARERGADRIICVMSGNAVQRGELAVFDKYVRAEAALLCGADLVLELPFPWCSASAEYFARAGIYLLSRFCDNVIFGSECGNIEALRSAAERAGSQEFRDEYRKRIEDGQRAAEAYFEMLKRSGAGELSSNDLLGIEYIRAALTYAPQMNFTTVKRDGAAYNGRELSKGENPSATALRELWLEGRFDDGADYIPAAAYYCFERAYYDGQMTDIYQLSRAILAYFRLADPKAFSDLAENDGGIANRICSAACEAASLEEMMKLLYTKRYTDAKLRRAMLFAACGVSKELLSAEPEYTTVLAANAKGREILSSVRKSCDVRIVTKPADAPADSTQYIASQRLDSIFTLAKMNTGNSGEYLKKNAYIE